ncbi:hypothetical protein PAXRUDRAFT_826696 [Paxillus rubicundulus Ve08.2h10]|uniref:Unplaced genomic scaffold scaffold_200, whole genome shotgun sequence n=1 Tax=Paxillus rubicundulus Ve08.2h10 TaxID=930991 RepID=A0A0D0DZ93_9AGAM|nr:hypothetical protein PAXRUDRAFT_826696 [Paxillus rubicundulus Ve08.2h10]
MGGSADWIGSDCTRRDIKQVPHHDSNPCETASVPVGSNIVPMLANDIAHDTRDQFPGISAFDSSLMPSTRRGKEMMNDPLFLPHVRS